MLTARIFGNQVTFFNELSDFFIQYFERMWKQLNTQKVLVGSPVYQKPDILNAFLTSLKLQNRNSITIDYMFIDDNTDPASKQLLESFKREESAVTILPGIQKSTYVCDEESHYWDDSLMLRVANYKNTIIKYAIQNQYDYLFLADSDLVLHPGLIEHLKTANQEIVSEIFWTVWHHDTPLLPNTWLFDEFDLVPKYLGEVLENAEKTKRQAAFLEQLKIPGLYNVGGLGACTLIHKSALLKGVNFSPIYNLTIHGEDRFFCIRAAVQDIPLFIDTYYPAYHIYREKDLAGVSAYVSQCNATPSLKRQYKNKSHKITLSMVVKDEEGRYLAQMLAGLRDHIDEAVIIDDASRDHTIAICIEALNGIPLHIISNQDSMFANESALRKKQWEETIKTNPDWILNLDADELLENAFWKHAGELTDDPKCDSYGFRLYDMWNKTQYREDTYWNAHKSFRTFFMRYQPDFHYEWNTLLQHCGRFPSNINLIPCKETPYRVQHYGWAVPSDRIAKRNRYLRLDPDAIFGIKEQYDSILAESPHLIVWQPHEK